MSHNSSRDNTSLANRLRKRLKNLIIRTKPEPEPLFESNERLLDSSVESRIEPRFIGTYTVKQLRKMLLDSPLLALLKSKGFDQLAIGIDVSDPYVHEIKLSDVSINNQLDYIGRVLIRHCVTAISSKDGPQDPSTLKLFQSKFTRHLDTLAIEWIVLQNPKTKFTAKRPQLPHQRHPGLGISKAFFQMLFSLASAKGRDCLIYFPDCFHNVYTLDSMFTFINPEFQGYYETLKRDLRKDLDTRGLAAVSWAIHLGCLLDISGEKPAKATWSPEELIHPLSQYVKDFLSCDEYQHIVKSSIPQKRRFKINWEQADRYPPCQPGFISLPLPQEQPEGNLNRAYASVANSGSVITDSILVNPNSRLNQSSFNDIHRKVATSNGPNIPEPSSSNSTSSEKLNTQSDQPQPQEQAQSTTSSSVELQDPAQVNKSTPKSMEDAPNSSVLNEYYVHLDEYWAGI